MERFYSNLRIPMREGKILREIRLALTKEGARVFRNNTGLFKTKDGRTIRTGLCVGSSDLIGWTKDGRFLAVEVKRPGGRKRIEQIFFIDKVVQSGGVAFFSTSPEDTVKNLKEFNEKKK